MQGAIEIGGEDGYGSRSEEYDDTCVTRGAEVLSVVTEQPAESSCSPGCCALPVVASGRRFPSQPPSRGPRPEPLRTHEAVLMLRGDEGASPLEVYLEAAAAAAAGMLPPIGRADTSRQSDGCAPDPTASVTSVRFSECVEALSPREIHDEEDNFVELPNVLVQISGQNEELLRVPLQRQFTRTAEGEPATPTSFIQYLSDQVGQNITAVYYPVRKANRQGGGRNSIDLNQFSRNETSGGGVPYPFVGGMKIVACVDGSDLARSPKSAVPCSGCVVC